MVVHVLLGASIQNIIYESEFWYQFMRFVDTDEKFVHFSKLSTVHVLYTAKVRNHLKTSKYKYITINKFWSVNRLYINTI